MIRSVLPAGAHDRGATIDALLAVARRETLVLVVAVGAMDDEGAAVASARLRWALGSAREMLAASDQAAYRDPRARQLDRIANCAQRWLVSEPPQPLHEISALVGRVAGVAGHGGRVIAAQRASLVDLDLDDLDLTRIALYEARLIDVTARRARCDAADARSSRWLRCELEGSSLVKVVLTNSTVEHTELSHANLESTSWHRAALLHCGLRHVRLVDARLDRAVLSDCSLRGADLSIASCPGAATLSGARFVRCDLRETNWTGRQLAGATFIDCKLFGAHGSPRLAGVVIERPDLSLAGDGSQIGTQAEVVASWCTMVGATSAHARV
ncbi:MAG TPA: pentapeptide repeat-containing protein [Kofleriaceae bacterium]|nr:pentapeptide repeat-containing protein [Kofleriaceae bacterium]